MNPEERALLDKSVKLSQENNKMLKQIQRAARRAAVWGFIKLLVILVPLVLGYIYLQPYFDQAFQTYDELRGVVEGIAL